MIFLQVLLGLVGGIVAGVGVSGLIVCTAEKLWRAIWVAIFLTVAGSFLIGAALTL